MRILIVDQDRNSRELIRCYCGGHSVKECWHSTDALSKAGDYDLIFTEVVFSGLAGRRYIEKPREATTGRIALVTAQENENYECDYFLRKPFTKVEIKKIIDEDNH